MITKEKNWPYLILGIASFLIFMLELILFMVEIKVYGNSSTAHFSFSFMQLLRHWGVTFVLWGSSAFLIHTIAKRKVGFDIFALKGKISAIGILFVLIISVLHIVFVSYLWDWTFKPITEFMNQARNYGANGWIVYIFQVVYYLFEDLAMMLVIAYGQEFGERQFGNKNVPWGGILLSLTWDI